MLGMAATVFEPATYNANIMDVDYGSGANATGSTTTIANNKKRDSSSLMVAGSESAPSFMTCDFYSNKKATALFTRPSSINQLDDDTLEAEDMMEMADLAYFTTGAFTDRACFDDMPEELVYLIFTFLHGSDIANGVQKVCRNWRRLALDDQVCITTISSPPPGPFPSIFIEHLHL